MYFTHVFCTTFIQDAYTVLYLTIIILYFIFFVIVRLYYMYSFCDISY